jgi:hypothetical protein
VPQPPDNGLGRLGLSHCSLYLLFFTDALQGMKMLLRGSYGRATERRRPAPHPRVFASVPHGKVVPGSYSFRGIERPPGSLHIQLCLSHLFGNGSDVVFRYVACACSY